MDRDKVGFREQPAGDAGLIGDDECEESALVDRTHGPAGARDKAQLLRRAEELHLFVQRPVPVEKYSRSPGGHLRLRVL